jgi:hypothetical protein
MSRQAARARLSDTYRRACERVGADSNTPRYAGIYIIMWLTLTDPNISTLNQGTPVVRILDNDDTLVSNCWNCLTVVASSEIMHGYAKEAVEVFQKPRTLLSVIPAPFPHGLRPDSILPLRKRQSEITKSPIKHSDT